MPNFNYLYNIAILGAIQLCQMNGVSNNMFTNHIYLIYMYKQDLVLNNLQ